MRSHSPSRPVCAGRFRPNALARPARPQLLCRGPLATAAGGVRPGYQLRQQNQEPLPGAAAHPRARVLAETGRFFLNSRPSPRPAQSKERVYKAFLEILNMYRKEEKGITEVYEEVAQLFKHHQDLLEEFTHFLPDSSPPQVAPSPRVRHCRPPPLSARQCGHPTCARLCREPHCAAAAVGRRQL